MRSFIHSAHIGRTPEHVFGFMTDFGNASRWMSLVKRLEFVGTGPAARGRQVLVTLDLMGKIRQTVSEMWSYDPPRRRLPQYRERHYRAVRISAGARA